jgi:mandelamide amidase
MPEKELLELTACGTLDLIREGKISCVELVSVLTDWARQHRSCNAFITLDEAGALRRARDIDKRISNGDQQGLLLGVPLVLKDNIETAGLPNTAGTPSLVNFIPDHTAPVARALIEQGAVILGKTNMHELAFGVTSNNRHFGAVGNPYRQDYFAGGSSGGTAAAVAGRMAPAGLGTDTGGSVRIPAAVTGIAGLRPGIRRYSREGITPISATRDTAGPMARCVADLVLLDAVIMGTVPDFTPAKPQTVRLGVPRRYFYENLDREITDKIAEALEQIEHAGVALVEADVPGMRDFESETGFSLALYEAQRGLSDYLRISTGGRVSFDQLAAAIASPDVREIFSTFMVGDRAPAQRDYQRAMEQELPAIRRIYQDYFTDNRLDGMIFPTVPVTAGPIAGCDESVLLNGRPAPTFATLARNTSPGSIAGIPGVTIPVGLSPGGLPIGIEIDGPWGSDARLLAIAMTLEQIYGTLPAPV